MEARLEAEDGELRQSVTPTQVLRATSTAGDAVLSISARRLGVSRLHPYPGWDPFREDIGQVMASARGLFDDVPVSRAGLRYLNRLRLPVGESGIALPEYLTFYPETPSAEMGLPATHFSQFLLQAVFPLDDELGVIRTQLSPMATDDESSPGSEAFMLDIDHFCDSQERLTTTTFMAWLEDAHQRVKDMFESCITDATRELLDPVYE